MAGNRWTVVTGMAGPDPAAEPEAAGEKLRYSLDRFSDTVCR